MANGKYKKWLKAESLALIKGWARKGLTDEQIAHNIGISRKTLAEWKNKYSDIGNALKKGKEVVDYEVENSLLQKALGKKETVKKAIKVKEVLYKDGKRLKEIEHVEIAEEEIYIPPDTAAIIFWLKNRKRNEWKNDPQLLELRKEELELKKQKADKDNW